jgi:hypothetical protein
MALFGAGVCKDRMSAISMNIVTCMSVAIDEV